jgi:hypothetical protein
VARTAQSQHGQQHERGPKRERRRAARQERRPIDGPVRQSFDAEDLIGESQYSAEQAGERTTHQRLTGGPPSDDPYTSSAISDLGRRYLEEATQSPAHEHYEPGADFEIEPEAECSSYDPDQDDLESEGDGEDVDAFDDEPTVSDKTRRR